ncbi:hypothetical protein BKA81DRAFT_371931, partial [Phyllosticta paracitricarpa]
MTWTTTPFALLSCQYLRAHGTLHQALGTKLRPTAIAGQIFPGCPLHHWFPRIDDIAYTADADAGSPTTSQLATALKHTGRLKLELVAISTCLLLH